MALGDFWSRIINGPNAQSNWSSNWVGQNIERTMLNGDQNDWAELFRNAGWGPGGSRGNMYQTVSPFAYQSYTKNASQYLPSQFYANVFANLYNNPANTTPGGDAFGAEALRAFLPQWASGSAPTANQDLAGARNQFNNAITNMSSAWNTYNAQEQNLNDATLSWNAAQHNVETAIANYNGGVATNASGGVTLSTGAQALQPIMEQLANLGLVNRVAVGTSGGYTYTWNTDAWQTNNILPKLSQLKPIVDELSEGGGQSTDWMLNTGQGQPNYNLAFSALSGDTTNYYNSAVAEAGAIANALASGGTNSQQYQKMFVQMLLNALGQGWGGAFHGAYVQDLQNKLNDYAQLYSGTNQNFFQWLANIYNGYL